MSESVACPDLRKDPVMESTKPRVLVLGSTGLTGSAIAADLDDASDRVEVVRASRDAKAVALWRSEGRPAVQLDLDDARTFAAALEGINRLFVMSGYTVAMTHQTKTITDAAADAGVGHIVHLGIFGNGRSTDPHFVARAGRALYRGQWRAVDPSSSAYVHGEPAVGVRASRGPAAVAGG